MRALCFFTFPLIWKTVLSEKTVLSKNWSSISIRSNLLQQKCYLLRLSFSFNACRSCNLYGLKDLRPRIFHAVGCEIWSSLVARHVDFGGLRRELTRIRSTVSPHSCSLPPPFSFWEHKQPLSANDSYHSFTVFPAGGSLPNFVRNMLWTTVADFVTLNQNTLRRLCTSVALHFDYLTTKLTSSVLHAKQWK
jgi:hypothetical protein